MRCCKTNPVIEVHGNKFCRKHFIKYYERKVEKLIKKLKGKKVIVAVSGGKDSMALAFLMNKFAKTYNINFELIFIDLGIKKYSDECKKVVNTFAKNYNIKLNIIKANKEIETIDEINKLRKKLKLVKPVCSYCGLIKRYLINKFAYENGFDFVVVGHNLDDELAFIFINMINQDLDQLARLSVITESNKKLKLIGRAKPLYFCSEKENIVYVLLNEINFYNGECPYAKNATQIKMKKLLDELEKEKPGFKINFLKSFLKIKENLKPRKEKIKLCKNCGFPTNLNICAFCKLKENLERNLN